MAAISLCCWVPGCSFRTPLVSEQFYPSMVDQLKVHHMSCHMKNIPVDLIRIMPDQAPGFSIQFESRSTDHLSDHSDGKRLSDEKCSELLAPSSKTDNGENPQRLAPRLKKTEMKFSNVVGKEQISEKKRHKCDYPGCQISKRYKGELQNHYDTVHMLQKPFVCDQPDCGSKFGLKSRLNIHIRHVHNKERPFPCSQHGCSKRFSDKGHLKRHVKAVHFQEKPHLCRHPDCGQKFGHKNSLNSHMEGAHGMQKPVRCLEPDCGRIFGRSKYLKDHLRQAHGK